MPVRPAVASRLAVVPTVLFVRHGRSSAKAVRNAVAMAYRFAGGDFIRRLEREVAGVAAPRES